MRKRVAIAYRTEAADPTYFCDQSPVVFEREVTLDEDWTVIRLDALNLRPRHPYSFDYSEPDPGYDKMVELTNPSHLSVSIDENGITSVAVSGVPYFTMDLASVIGDHDLDLVDVVVGRDIGDILVVLYKVDRADVTYLPYFFTPSTYNAHHDQACGETYRSDTFSDEVASCQRPAGHFGHHQAIAHTKVYSFDQGGAMSGWFVPFGKPINCVKCGFVDLDNNYDESTHLCFHCSFWVMQKTRETDTAFIIKGRHYRPGKGGFYGRKFNIKKYDGSTWSGELFTQGQIPDHFRDEMPDNAVFIETKNDIQPSQTRRLATF